jgi:hypothetical protein
MAFGVDTVLRGIGNGIMNVAKATPLGGAIQNVQNTIGNIGSAVGGTIEGHTGNAGDYQSNYSGQNQGGMYTDIANKQAVQQVDPSQMIGNLPGMAGAGQAQAAGAGMAGQAAQIAPMLV